MAQRQATQTGLIGLLACVGSILLALAGACEIQSGTNDMSVAESNNEKNVAARLIDTALKAADFESFAGHNNMLQLIHLRWLAVLGQIITIAVVTLGLNIHLPLLPMCYVLAFLIAFNIGSHLRWHEESRVSNREVFFALLIDVAILTAQLYLSGGTSNPFVFLYLLQIILSAVLLEIWTTWLIVVMTAICLLMLSSYSQPLDLALTDGDHLSAVYLDGVLVCFLLNAALLVYFLTRVTNNLRNRDGQIALLRQRATEEEHIVKMGLLASGAAHELGTPLATMSVIVGDWRRMPSLTNDAVMAEELEEMQIQLQRCKRIVSGVLLSAGEARGESSVKTSLNTCLDELAEEFRLTRPVAEFVYQNHIQQDIPVVFDSALKQMIGNVLDNAMDASPDWVKLEVHCENQRLHLRVSDRGPGFAPHILDKIGQPYQSTKGRPGSGLGLFFVVNVLRKLEGSVAARNLAQGGALVEISFPLSALML